MTKYFLSRTENLWAWKDGVTMLWNEGYPVWEVTMWKYQLGCLEKAERLKPITEAEVKQITGGLPAWQNIF